MKKAKLTTPAVKQDPYKPDENLSIPNDPAQDPPNPPNTPDHIEPEPDVGEQTSNKSLPSSLTSH